MPRNSSAAVVVAAVARRRRRRPAEKNPDGKIAQDGNLLFQKCPSGLGGYENGLDLFK